MKARLCDYRARVTAQCRRSWKECLLLVVFLIGGFYFSPFVLFNLSYSLDSRHYSLTRAPPIDNSRFTPSTTMPTRTAAPTSFAFTPSQFAELPMLVNFSHRTDLVFDQVQGSSILVYDLQWVPTLSAIVLIISDRIVPEERSPTKLGMHSSLETFIY
jgi:hypothetical protein